MLTPEICARQSNGGDVTVVTSLPEKKRGCPLLLGEELDKPVCAYVTNSRDNGAVLNIAITIGCAEETVKNKDSNLLQANGGHIALTK